MKKLPAFSPFMFLQSFQTPDTGHQQTNFFIEYIPIFPSIIFHCFNSNFSPKKACKWAVCMVERHLSGLKRSLSKAKRFISTTERVLSNKKRVLFISKRSLFNSKRVLPKAERVLSFPKRSLSFPERTLSTIASFNFSIKWLQVISYQIAYLILPAYKYYLITGGNYFDRYFTDNNSKCKSSLLTGFDATKNSFLIGLKLFVHAAREDGLAGKAYSQIDNTCPVTGV